MAKSIRQKAKLLMNEAGTQNLMQIAEYLNVTILEREYSDAVKGYCFSFDNKSYIIINSIFQECKKKIILAHEIAHLYLHKRNKINTMAGRITFFPINNLTEIEANIFAAELIINDEFEVDLHSTMVLLK